MYALKHGAIIKYLYTKMRTLVQTNNNALLHNNNNTI